ncbi:hypothetical protein [Frigidibacter oleivorans]|uniref:hypothetical protein n=1 Tax=Frigidibacter oleivorans TaxID=2487129 RepID=UPI000F8C6C55|nr:hypothetical protein [Frigidibacter oleivorans]
MNLNRLIDMVVGSVMKRMVNRGVDAGFDYMSGKKGKGAPTAAPGKPAPAQKGQRDLVKKARAAARVSRKLR